MGKLRTEPKYVSFLSPQEYDFFVSVLQEAQKESENNHVFWDMDEEEKPAHAKKAFTYVARKVGIDVTIRQVRGTKSLAFQFKKGKRPSGRRISAAECSTRILQCLEAAGEPVKKIRILKETGISPSTWNMRIKDLIERGLVKRHGQRRDTTYSKC